MDGGIEKAGEGRATMCVRQIEALVSLMTTGVADIVGSLWDSKKRPDGVN